MFLRRGGGFLAPVRPALRLGPLLGLLRVEVFLEQALRLAGVAGLELLQRSLAAIVVAGGQRAGRFLKRRQLARGVRPR